MRSAPFPIYINARYKFLQVRLPWHPISILLAPSRDCLNYSSFFFATDAGQQARHPSPCRVRGFMYKDSH